MQLLKHLTTLLLCVTSACAFPAGYDDTVSVDLETRAGTSSTASTAPKIGTELAWWNKQSGVPSSGLGLGLYLFQGTLPRDTSGDSKYSKLIVDGMNAAKANHHYLIGVIVTDKTTGPKGKQVTTRDVTSVVAWDIAVQAGTEDTMVIAKSSSAWKRTMAPTVTYKYYGKAKSDSSPAINTIGMF